MATKKKTQKSSNASKTTRHKRAKKIQNDDHNESQVNLMEKFMNNDDECKVMIANAMSFDVPISDRNLPQYMRISYPWNAGRYGIPYKVSILCVNDCFVYTLYDIYYYCDLR